MDVTCDRCGTDYEFEEALVSARGTTVKCTQCGHLFKVWKQEAAPSPAPAATADGPEETHPWTVRRVNGSTQRLASLADLTRLIGDGSFSANDEVSRTGKAWKKIGEIDELKAFFPDASGPDSAAPRARKRTASPELGLPKPSPEAVALPRGVGSLPPSPPKPQHTSEPPAARARTSSRFESLGQQVDLDARGAVRSTRPVVPVTPSPATPKAAPATPPASTRASPASSSDLDAATTSRHRAASPDTTASPRSTVREPARASYSWLWALLLIASAAGAAVFLLWPRLTERNTAAAPREPAAEFIARADAAFATHRVQHFEDAVTEYVKALAFHDSDPHILSSASRVYAVWAQELAFKAELTARPDGRKDIDRRSEILSLDRERRQLAEQAKRYAEMAARKNPGNEEAGVALADALRLSGNLVAARSELDRARATESTPSAETLRVAALLASDEAKGDLRTGLPLAAQAVAQEPELIRTRLLLARALIADGDANGARYHLSTVETRDRGHPGVLAVQKLLEIPTPPAKAADAEPDGGKPAGTPVDPNAPPEDLSHEGYTSRGQFLLEHGEVAAAKRMFEQALFIRPSSAKAHTGLGYVALEKGRPQLAVEHFLPAARIGNLEALIGLGDAYRRLARPRDALKAYQTYLAREPSGPRSNIARAQVERLSDELGSK